MLDFELNVGWLGDVEVVDVENEDLPCNIGFEDRQGRSAAGKADTREGERIMVGRMLGRAVGGLGGRAGGLRGVGLIGGDLVPVYL